MEWNGYDASGAFAIRAQQIQIQIFIIMHYLQNITRSTFTEITRNTKRKRLNNT